MTVYLDTETTGLDSSDDEIIEIGIVDADGQPLLDTLVRPVRHTEWPEAEEINGISPPMVVDAPLLSELSDAIEAAVAGQEVVIYNAAFDASFLGPLLQSAASVECCMLPFAEVYGAWHDYWESYTWQSLLTAANYVGYEWPSDQHRALADALACRAVWRYLTDDAERERIDAEKLDRSLVEQAKWDLKLWQERIESERLRFELGQSTRFLRQLGMAEPATGLESWTPYSERKQRRKDRLEDVIFAFTGYSGVVWRRIHAFIETVPVYQKRADIPAGLLNRSQVRKKHPSSWILDALRPDALYLSPSRKSWSYLYTVDQIAKVIASEPLRGGYTPGPGMTLVTATELRKAGLKPADFTPVAEDYNGNSHAWYPLYECPIDRLEPPQH